jgi:hypothetical protein
VLGAAVFLQLPDEKEGNATNKEGRTHLPENICDINCEFEGSKS